MKKKLSIIVGLSGGVDSAVAAYLLQQQGHQVKAVFMKNFSPRSGELLHCPWKEDRRSAYEVAAFLGITIETWDLEKEYRVKVLDYLYKEYQAGRTPNPDIQCNSEIKFKVFLKLALAQGASHIATGHYAGVKKGRDNLYHLLKGKDPDKDQSYFLAGLEQNQLQNVLFPLHKLKKIEVRALAKKIGLPNYNRPDSQGICFVGEVKMQEFLRAKIKPKRGNIVDRNGNILGQHQGVYYYTIGQRKGLDLGGGPARYVMSKNMKKNELVVVEEKDPTLYTKIVEATHWHWLAKIYTAPLQAKAKIRYRQVDQQCRLVKKQGMRYCITFAKAQRAVTPGQVIAIYIRDQLIASGIITDVKE